ncbi:ferritin family protein [Desulfosediminicola flagellatus]|uniref:ferritin family protein n=1 Tax=Desulfosediminicola flagellatus TaxID=2569541 RepID=UPI0010AD89A3|nr:ferritin family protein [Desulfosediminicola flagellatus]
MDSIEIFKTAIAFEEKIRDLYLSADKIVDDKRGKAIFKALADDEQSHVDFLLYSIKQLEESGVIDHERLTSPIPSKTEIEANIESMKAQIPERMLGDIKTVLNSALQLEKETSAYYREASKKTDGDIKIIMEMFQEIEDRHVDVVQIELDHASNNGMWFDFMEGNLEVE